METDANVIDLMERLRSSLGQAARGGPRSNRASTRETRTSTKTTRRRSAKARKRAA
jgi:hypothetical protein